MLQDGQQTLLDASNQLQSGVQVFWFEQPDTGGQVGALQQCLLCKPVNTSQTSTARMRMTHCDAAESHLAGSAGRWCAGPEPQSAAPSRPSSPSPGCSSCRRRSRPTPAGRVQGTVNVPARRGGASEED